MKRLESHRTRDKETVATKTLRACIKSGNPHPVASALVVVDGGVLMVQRAPLKAKFDSIIRFDYNGFYIWCSE